MRPSFAPAAYVLIDRLSCGSHGCRRTSTRLSPRQTTRPQHRPNHGKGDKVSRSHHDISPTCRPAARLAFYRSDWALFAGQRSCENIMNSISRRNMLTAAAAGSLVTAATVAHAQSNERYRSHSGPAMAAPIRVRAISRATGRTPTFSCRPLPITARCQICVFHSRTRICAWRREAGPVR